MQKLRDNADELARGVRMFIMDVDGVLTDGRILFVGDSEGVAFSVHDGTGIKYLQRCGVQTAIITGREVAAVRARARDLGIEHVVLGAKVKMQAYEEIRDRTGHEDEAVAYIGDDLPDIPVMRRVGLALTVPGAPTEVVETAHAVTGTPGGRGAVREAAEFILRSQHKWERILQRYLPPTEGEEPR
ncbi:MAG: HAD family hydrolase [Candidatus Brocadiaceae bacterium]|jgi:3-deoxy-D-manno-octulosonate 8-phosphate phosphatase (KDO 8-P phosphatase)